MKTKKELIDLVNKRIKFLKAEARTANYTDDQKYGFVCGKLPVDLDKAEKNGKIDKLYHMVPKSIAFSKFLRTFNDVEVVEEIVEPIVEPVIEPVVEPVIDDKKSEATIEEVLDDEEEIDE